MVESGLGETKEGRALFITLTLTESTWSVVSTVTTDLTTVSSCVSASVSECAAARSGLQKDVSNGPAILVSHTGEEYIGHLDNLETHTGNITDSMTFTTESSNQNFVVLLTKFKQPSLGTKAVIFLPFLIN